MAVKKMIVEKKTGEKYASKQAMARHERTEPKKEARKEGDKRSPVSKKGK